jgi:protein TonB
MHATALSFPTSLHDLDFQRIAGTSLVIALHAAVALVLFMPVQRQEAPMEETIVIPDWTKRIIPPPPPPPPIDRHQKPTITKVPVPIAPPTAAPMNNDVDPSPDAIGPYVPPQIGVVTPQDTGPSFVELAPDVAPAPTYPGTSLRLNQEGRVLLRVLVDEQGRPTQVTIEQSSGFRLLDQAALKAVQSRWHFVPAQRDGVAVAAYALVPVEFRIDR